MEKTRLRAVLAVAIAFGFFILLTIFLRLYANMLWFDSLNFASVFWTALWTKIGAGFIFGLLFLLLFGANVYWAMRVIVPTIAVSIQIKPQEESPPPDEETGRDKTHQAGEEGNGLDEKNTTAQESSEPSQPFLTDEGLKYAIVVMGVFFTIISALVGASRWDLFLRYFNQQPFADTEPIFGKNVGFFVFSLPFLKFIYGWFLVSLVGIMGIVGSIYYTRHAIVSEESGFRFADCAKSHLSVLGGALLLLFAYRYWLKGFDLLFSSRGAAFGANYTDVHVQLWAFRFLLFAAIIAAVVLIANIRYRRPNLPLVVVGSFIGAMLLVSVIIPRIAQRLIVVPNELEQDRKYIQYSIKYTREAYNLDKIKESEFVAADDLTRQDLQDNDLTIQNIRIWDKRPLLRTYEQLQELRTYYNFHDIDEDRYVIDGKYRQVMLSAREIPVSELPKRTWVNEKLLYTHGYGFTMSPVNQITSQGLPELFIKDIPPVPSIDLEIKRPEIYYGEQTNGYIIVGTKEEELDYPKGDTNVRTRYQGSGGVPINSLFRRWAFSAKFFDVKLLLTNLTKESRILLNRSLYQCLRTIAPFLHYDEDPYLVVFDGKLYWIQDAYTITNTYPYSARFQNGNLNYIRNSVKIVVDAYNGKVSFYVTDEVDPILKTYRKIFPKLFVPLNEMPAGLKAHIRYPRDLFKIQAYMYGLYHMQDIQVFYNQEDLWTIPYEMYSDKKQLIGPYYVTLKMPDSEKEEFVLILPFTPSDKDNMISWMAARSDFPHYGELLVYKIPKQKLVFGPLQVEARIDQQPEISREFTLWEQKGSRVIRGNLLVIPIKNSFIYVEPVYLEARREEQQESAQTQMEPGAPPATPQQMAQQQRKPIRPRRSEIAALPELKQVIVAYGEKVVMKDNLQAALEAVFGSPEFGVRSSEFGITEVYNTAESAMKHFQKAREAMQKWDMATFGKELDEVEKGLRKIMELEEKK
jgi:uncharacterized membrane protein (UPF0182 family)